MSYFVSDITIKSILVFLLIGCSASVFYRVFNNIRFFIKNPTILNIILRGAIKGEPRNVAIAKLNEEKSVPKSTSDLMLATIIIFYGIYLTLALYVLCDGVPRFYAVLSVILGCYLANLCLGKLRFRRVKSVIFSVVYFSFWLLAFPIRIFFLLKRQKVQKNTEK